MGKAPRDGGAGALVRGSLSHLRNQSPLAIVLRERGVLMVNVSWNPFTRQSRSPSQAIHSRRGDPVSEIHVA